jgi:dTDP-glucose 4,6-dehydratase
MDITKIGSELGWEPREWLESGLQKTVEWYLTNDDWVAAIQKQSDYQSWLDKNYQKRGDQE